MLEIAPVLLIAGEFHDIPVSLNEMRLFAGVTMRSRGIGNRFVLSLIATLVMLVFIPASSRGQPQQTDTLRQRILLSLPGDRFKHPPEEIRQYKRQQTWEQELTDLIGCDSRITCVDN